MLPRTVTALALACVLALMGGCSSEDNPYVALSDDASKFVIPGSEDWASGELCSDGGSCSGAITVSVIENYDWYRIIDLTVAQDDSTEGSVTASLSVGEARSAAGSEKKSVAVRAWGPDVDDVKAVLAEEFEVWVGVDSESDYVAVFSAFDTDGRVAGIGNAAAEYFTIAVAELAAEAQAPSAFAYLDPIMAR
jgi:hypothetical protein